MIEYLLRNNFIFCLSLLIETFVNKMDFQMVREALLKLRNILGMVFRSCTANQAKVMDD
jgi:hypothetical protein